MTPRRNQERDECLAGVGHSRPCRYGFCQPCYNKLPSDIRERLRFAYTEGDEEINAAIESALNEL